MFTVVSNFDVFFPLNDKGREDPNITLSGLSSARQQNTIIMAFCWHTDDCPILNVGLVAL